MIIKIVANFFGAVLFLYLLWRRLKEDYKREDVISAAFLILIADYLGFLLAKYLLPGWWFWVCLVFSFSALYFSSRKFKIKIFEAIDAYVFSSFSLLTMYLLQLLISDPSLVLGLTFLVSLIFVAAFLVVNANYKRFRWYKSGRVGFTGIAISALFFLTKGVIALFADGVVLFSGVVEPYLAFTLVAVCVFIIYRLSRTQI